MKYMYMFNTGWNEINVFIKHFLIKTIYRILYHWVVFRYKYVIEIETYFEKNTYHGTLFQL